LVGVELGFVGEGLSLAFRRCFWFPAIHGS
jgi:hypothetical protein